MTLTSSAWERSKPARRPAISNAPSSSGWRWRCHCSGRRDFPRGRRWNRAKVARPQWSSSRTFAPLLCYPGPVLRCLAHALRAAPHLPGNDSVGLDAVGISARRSSPPPVWPMNAAPAVPSARHPRRAADARPLLLRGFLHQIPLTWPAGCPSDYAFWRPRCSVFPTRLSPGRTALSAGPGLRSIRCCQWASACCSTKQAWLTRHSAEGGATFSS